MDYGRFDVNRLLKTLVVVNGEHGGLDLAISRGGIQSLEALILARYYMFSQVYCHRTRRIYDIYLANYLKQHWGKKRLNNLLDVLVHDDYSMLNEIRRYINSDLDNKKDIRYWASRIFYRKHHTVILDTNHFASANQRQEMSRIQTRLTKEYAGYDFILDMEAKGTIHKFYVRGDEKMAEKFRVVSEAGDRIITDESRIIKQMPKEFQVVRLYVDCADQTVLTEIRNKAQELGKEIKE